MDRVREGLGIVADFPQPLHKLNTGRGGLHVVHAGDKKNGKISFMGQQNGVNEGGVGVAIGVGGHHHSHQNTPSPTQLLPELLTNGGGSISSVRKMANLSLMGNYPQKQSSKTIHSNTDGANSTPTTSGTSTPSANKIVSQNVNGTQKQAAELFHQGCRGDCFRYGEIEWSPSQARRKLLVGCGLFALIVASDSELQLLRVLQRANLLSYFDIMIELGGDDVQQLCEAGEEEFLEIMALIGMASKPLHVRRLQKALQEWMSNPSLFQSPVLPPAGIVHPQPSHGRNLSPPLPIRPVPNYQPISLSSKLHVTTNNNPTSSSILSNPHQHSSSSNSNSPNSRPSPSLIRIPVDQLIPSHFLEQRMEQHSPGPNSMMSSDDSHSPIPYLLPEPDLRKVIDATMKRIKILPPYVFEPQIPSKRKFSGDFEMIMRLSQNDPRRGEEIRKMSTIYGRPDPNCSTHPNKRRYPKPLTMHEVCVNEAAAQLCKHVPTLLTYRDELAALSKEIVRDAGLPYSSNNNCLSFSNQNRRTSGEIAEGIAAGGANANKRLKLLEGAIEIQEYSRPSSNNSDIGEENAMQITQIRNIGLRSSPTVGASPTRSNESGSPRLRIDLSSGAGMDEVEKSEEGGEGGLVLNNIIKIESSARAS